MQIVVKSYICQFTFCQLIKSSQSLSIILQGARIIKSSHFMKRYHLGRKISFVCVAKGVPRPQITWMKDGLELKSYAGYEHVGVSKIKSDF